MPKHHSILLTDLKRAIGVMCSCYISSAKNTKKFVLCNQSTSHQYVSVDCYLCTLTPGCIEQVIANDLVEEATSLTITKASTTNLMVTEEFVITFQIFAFHLVVN